MTWGDTVLFGERTSRFPTIDLDRLGELYYLSKEGASSIPIDKVRRLAKTPPGRRAVDKITHGVLAMPLLIKPKKEDEEKKAAWERAEQIQNALKQPNVEHNNGTWRKFISAMLKDLLCAGAAAVERQPGKGDHPFWLWGVDIVLVHLNPDWDPTNELKHPRYLVKDPTKPNTFIEMTSDQLFLVQHSTSTYEVVSPGPMQIAYGFIQAWLDLGDYQKLSTSKATRNAILQLIDADEEELQAFREYWNYQIEGEGEVPIINKEVQIANLNAPDDAALYPQYEEKLLRIIALAFGLAVRDMNLSEHDNRATAGVAADSAFQDAILPYARTIEEHVDLEVIKKYCPEFRAELADTEPRTEAEETKRGIDVFQGGIAKRDEGRQMAGLPPLGGNEGAAFADGKPADETEAGEHSEDLEPPKEPAVKPKKEEEDLAATNGKSAKATTKKRNRKAVKQPN